MSKDKLELKLDESVADEFADEVSDMEIVDTIRGLVDVYNSLGEIDGALMSRRKQDEKRKWMNKIWRSMRYYMDCLSEGEEEDDDE